jgi:hypothetical protein
MPKCLTVSNGAKFGHLVKEICVLPLHGNLIEINMPSEISDIFNGNG